MTRKKQPSRALIENWYKAFEEMEKSLNKGRHLLKLQDMIANKRQAYSGLEGY